MKAYVNPYILKLIDEALSDEVSDYMFYTVLEEKCPDMAEMFRSIAADEMKHKKMLTELYTDLNGKAPAEKKPELKADLSKSCKELIKEQIPKELEGAAMYRTLYFAMPSVTEKNIIFEIMTDEMMHATWLAGADENS